MLVVGGTDGPPVGGGEASVLVDVGPVLPVFPDPPPPNPSIHLVEVGSTSVVVVPVIEDVVEEREDEGEVIEEGKDDVGFVPVRDTRLGLEDVKADEADEPELADGTEDVCAGDDADELISGRDVVAEVVETDDVVEVADVKLLAVSLGVSAVSEL